VPRDLSPLRTEWQTFASRLRTRQAARAGHYQKDRVRARLDAAICPEVARGLDRTEIVDVVTADVVRVTSCR
jgi:hypothetical protein